MPSIAGSNPARSRRGHRLRKEIGGRQVKRKTIGIIYESHKGTVVPDEKYGIDKHGAIRLKGGRRRLTKGQRQALKMKT
jgi:hypothetical protein